VTHALLLWGLFSGSFLSSTLLPGNSEVLLVTLLFSSNISPVLLILTATIGNTLGGLTNVIIGRMSANIKPQKGVTIALPWIKRYGSLALLLSWLPIVGDLLCLLAGWLKLPWWSVILTILIGKLLRYVVLAAIVLQSLS
jgi:membrane protein YqaA with SNARE-associated domain